MHNAFLCCRLKVSLHFCVGSTHFWHLHGFYTLRSPPSNHHSTELLQNYPTLPLSCILSFIAHSHSLHS